MLSVTVFCGDKEWGNGKGTQRMNVRPVFLPFSSRTKLRLRLFVEKNSAAGAERKTSNNGKEDKQGAGTHKGAQGYTKCSQHIMQKRISRGT